MEAKLEEHKNAVKLRKLGYSHSEILKKVKVTRSTLTSWLKNIHLTKPKIERLRLKKENGRKLGSLILKRNRIEKTKEIINKARSEINNLDESHLKVIGSILYWAEGSKQKEHDPSKELVFSNSDPKMIKLYLLWLQRCLLIKADDILFEIYIHRTYNKTEKELINYWSKVTNSDTTKFKKIYFKKNKVHTFRKNKGKDYHGVLRISVRKSTDLNRKVTGLIQGIYEEYIH